MSGKDEREIRAYEEPEKIGTTGENKARAAKIAQIYEKNFSGGSLLYNYYRYLDRFKTEPRDWKALIEFTEYEKTDSEIQQYVTQLETNNGR